MTVFPFGYAKDAAGNAGMGVMLTWEQMMTKSTVNRLQPEVQRRFKALIEAAAAAGVPLGCGTGWRVQPVNKPGFAKPGNSWHEGCPVDSGTGAIAIDTVPAMSWNWMEANCAKYGFRTFRNVNNEPWHIQPTEATTSRQRAATVQPPLQRFNLPGQANIDVPRPTLRKGSTGQEVVELINQLKFWKWYPAQYMSDVNDGKFGGRTDTGVRNMQRALRITVDGVYGNQSADALRTFLEAMSALAAG